MILDNRILLVYLFNLFLSLQNKHIRNVKGGTFWIINTVIVSTTTSFLFTKDDAGEFFHLYRDTTIDIDGPSGIEIILEGLYSAHVHKDEVLRTARIFQRRDQAGVFIRRMFTKMKS